MSVPVVLNEKSIGFKVLKNQNIEFPQVLISFLIRWLVTWFNYHLYLQLTKYVAESMLVFFPQNRTETMPWRIRKWTPTWLSNNHEGHFPERLHTNETYSQPISQAKQTSGTEECDAVSMHITNLLCELYVGLVIKEFETAFCWLILWTTFLTEILNIYFTTLAGLCIRLIIVVISGSSTLDITVHAKLWVSIFYNHKYFCPITLFFTFSIFIFFLRYPQMAKYLLFIITLYLISFQQIQCVIFLKKKTKRRLLIHFCEHHLYLNFVCFQE